jgi:hypothetical protein
MDQWDVWKILIDNGSQAEILFLSTFEPVGVVTLPISFGTTKTPLTEYITYDIIDMLYPYNAIFGRGLLNTFEVALHSADLCLKVPATFSAIIVRGSQKEARDIEQDFTPGHKNVHFLRQDASKWQLSWKQNIPASFQDIITTEGKGTKAVEPRQGLHENVVHIRRSVFG